MKNTLLILAGIGLFCVLLIVRSFYRQDSRMDAEREWFVKGVGYEFSARVDSIRMLNESTGGLWCIITSGNPHPDREDSLKLLFREHDMLYLIFKRSGDTVRILVPDARPIREGDSMHVSSSNNSIQFFREGKQIANDELTETLTGFGRPFFLKKKK